MEKYFFPYAVTSENLEFHKARNNQKRLMFQGKTTTFEIKSKESKRDFFLKTGCFSYRAVYSAVLTDSS